MKFDRINLNLFFLKTFLLFVTIFSNLRLIFYIQFEFLRLLVLNLYKTRFRLQRI